MSGGALNVAATDPTFIPSAASVSGGACNVAGAGTPLSQCSSLDTFDFPAPSVSGGTQNVASGHRASISGGQGNDASGTNSSVSGGVLIHGSNNNEWHAGQSAGFPTGTEY